MGHTGLFVIESFKMDDDDGQGKGGGTANAGPAMVSADETILLYRLPTMERNVTHETDTFLA